MQETIVIACGLEERRLELGSFLVPSPSSSRGVRTVAPWRALGKRLMAVKIDYGRVRLSDATGQDL
jgi:hypothetical protein